MHNLCFEISKWKYISAQFFCDKLFYSYYSCFIRKVTFITLICLSFVFSWSLLKLYTNGTCDDHQQAQAAGLAEGYITAEQISMDWQNTVGVYCDDSSEFCDKLHRFLKDLFDWIQSQIKENPEDPYWYQVSLLFLTLNLINYKVALYQMMDRLIKANFPAEQRSIHIH